MQLLSDASSAGVRPESCAREVMETVPLVMQFIRRQMRSLRGQDLTVPQIRTLWFITHHSHPSLSDAADFIGLSLPAMSRLVDGLVRKSLVTRTACPDDRRHVRLGVTSRGQAALDSAWKGTHSRVTEVIANLSARQRAVVESAMSSLNEVFGPSGDEPRDVIPKRTGALQT
jgi:DNA-binding MarR family transcriptional regulator